MSAIIPLGYGTYGMLGADLRAVLPRLRKIGYDAVELAVGDRFHVAPDALAQDDRRSLRDSIRESGWPQPACMAFLDICVSGDERNHMLDDFRGICRLARDLSWKEDASIVTSTIGKSSLDWSSDRGLIRSSLVEIADIASEHNVIFCVEPHVGGAFDTPEKAAWVIDKAKHPNLRLNFDISHFHVQGMDLARCVDLCLPRAAHVHVKDGYIDSDGRTVFQLPGEGNLDLDRYFQCLRRLKCRMPVTVEVSAQIWRAPGYEPWGAATRAFTALDGARKRAVGWLH